MKINRNSIPNLGLIGITRPFWSFFLTFCYYLIILIVVDIDLLTQPILGFLSMFFFFLGHFSLNSICDKVPDNFNPRKNNLNSWKEVHKINSKNIILFLIALFWIISIYLSFIFIFIYKFDLKLPTIIIFSIIFSIIYSVPPIQVKGRAPFDMIINILSFGVLGSVFAIESINSIINVPNFYI